MHGPEQVPFEPPLAFGHLAAPGGRVGDSVEDFCVDEIPLYAADGDGDHWYVQLEKRSMTTPQLIRAVASASGANERDIGRAGLKDRHAITTQWLSVPVPKTAPPPSWELPEGVRLCEATRHRNKLKPGHLAGNRFRIVLRELDATDAVQPLVDAIIASGVPNFYGTQRFGRGQKNLDEAMAWLDGRIQLRGKQARFLRNLLPSVVQSEFFNRYLVRREAEGRDRFVLGEWVRLNGSGRHVTIEDVALEQPRLASGDLVLTGPLPGGKTQPSKYDAAALEDDVRAEMGLTDERMGRLNAEAPGARRDLYMRVDDLAWTALDGGAIALTFSLPAGGYATQVAREFTRLPWAAPLRPEAT